MNFRALVFSGTLFVATTLQAQAHGTPCFVLFKNLKTNDPYLSQTLLGDSFQSRATLLSPDGRLVARLGELTPGHQTLDLIPTQSNGRRAWMRIPIQGALSPESLAWSPNGRSLAAMNRSDGTLRVFERSAGQESTIKVNGALKKGEDPSRDLSSGKIGWSADGKRISIYTAGRLAIVDRISGKPLIDTGSKSSPLSGVEVVSVLWHPVNSEKLAFTDVSGKIRILDLEQRNVQQATTISERLSSWFSEKLVGQPEAAERPDVSIGLREGKLPNNGALDLNTTDLTPLAIQKKDPSPWKLMGWSSDGRYMVALRTTGRSQHLASPESLAREVFEFQVRTINTENRSFEEFEGTYSRRPEAGIGSNQFQLWWHNDSSFVLGRGDSGMNWVEWTAGNSLPRLSGSGNMKANQSVVANDITWFWQGDEQLLLRREANGSLLVLNPRRNRVKWSELNLDRIFADADWASPAGVKVDILGVSPDGNFILNLKGASGLTRLMSLGKKGDD